MDFLLPKLSATMETAKVGQWFKKVGDCVKMGEPLVEIETDKAAMEVEAPADAVVESIVGETGAELGIGALLATLRPLGEVKAAPVAPSPKPAATPAVALAPVAAPPQPAPAPRQLASPLARRLADLHAVDLASLSGSGPHGRIRKRDVLAATTARQPAAAEPVPAPAPRVPVVTSGAFEPLSAMRAQIAASVTLSRQTIPAFVLARWAETTAIARAKALLSPEAEARTGIKLTFTDFVLQALADTLRQFPLLLDRYTERDGHPGRIRGQAVDIGLVVAVPDGVMIPVLRDLGGRSLTAIASARQGAVQRARAGRLSQADAGPASISVSNIGRGGADRFEAIIGPGQTAILAIGREHEKVIPRAGGMAVALGVNLTLSVDHRLIDGVAGGDFLGALADRLTLGPWNLD